MSRKMNTNSPSLPSSQRDFDPLLFEASLSPLVMKEAVLLTLTLPPSFLSSLPPSLPPFLPA